MSLPSVAVVIPTLNAARVLADCLKTLTVQDYPRERLSVVIADAGSTDETIAIVERFRKSGLPVTVVDNPLKTGEAGKFAGLQAADADIIALIDSDNLLPDPEWLVRMVRPFQEDATLVASEPIAYAHRREDGYINRYCALLGMNDPLCLFLGNYDRLCAVTNRWTGLPVIQEDRGDWLKVTLGNGALPTIGANGFLIRRDLLVRYCPGPYLFDVDVLHEVVRQSGSVAVAKVKNDIVHLYCSDYRIFARKQRRRVMDYFHHRGKERVDYPALPGEMRAIVLFSLSCITVLPLLAQALIGFARRPDLCWAFHLPACWMTLWIYAKGTLLAKLGLAKGLSRASWSQ